MRRPDSVAQSSARPSVENPGTRSRRSTVSASFALTSVSRNNHVAGAFDSSRGATKKHGRKNAPRQTQRSVGGSDKNDVRCPGAVSNALGSPAIISSRRSLGSLKNSYREDLSSVVSARVQFCNARGLVVGRVFAQKA